MSRRRFAGPKRKRRGRRKRIQEVSAAILEKNTPAAVAAQLKRQVADISSHLLMTFEEITLLHRLTEHLSISKSVTDLCELSVNWLADVIPAKVRRDLVRLGGRPARASTRSATTPTASRC